MRGLLGDIRYSVRMLLKNPGPTAIALVALMLGIGANTACFSTVYALVRHPFPFAELDRIVRVWDADSRRGTKSTGLAAGDFLDLQSESRSFSHMAAFTVRGESLTGVTEPERLQGFAVSSSFFPLLGIQPALGRWLAPEEDVPGRDGVVVIGYGLWTRRFASDPNIIGRAIELDGNSVTVTGVMPQKFDFPLGTDIWRPLAITAAQQQDRGSRTLAVLARLRPGVTLGQAAADLKAIDVRIEARFPTTNAGHTIDVTGILQSANEVTERFVMLLQAAAAFVLLLACVNVANLQVARGMARERETALRTAVGASNFRILRLHIIENLVLAFTGAALGLGMAVWMLDLQRAAIPEEVYKWVAGARDMKLNGEGLLMAVASAIVTGVICGMAPALQALRSGRMGEALKEGGRGNSGPRRSILRQVLVVAEIALALVLLVSAGLMVQTFRHIVATDLGYQPDHLLSFSTDLPPARYRQPEAIKRFQDDVVNQVAAVDGVVNVGIVTSAPATAFRVEGQADRPGDIPPSVQLVTPGYIEALGLARLKGRIFTSQDAEYRPTRSVVITESVARKYWNAGTDPVGAKVAIAGENLPPFTVIGVVGDLKDWFFAMPQPAVYVMSAQLPRRAMRVWVRTADDPMKVVPGLRAGMRTVDANQPIYAVKPEEQVLSEQQSGVRMSAIMMLSYALIALALAASGIYGVVAWSVARRTHELGIRMALGAKIGDVLRMVMMESMRLAAVGLAIGLVVSYGLTRLMASALYGVVSLDPLVFVGVALMLGGAALLAGYVPARRATTVDPLIALRYE